MWYRLNVAVFAWYFRRAFGFRIEGQEHEPRPPFIIVANHARRAAPPLVTRARRCRAASAANTRTGPRARAGAGPPVTVPCVEGRLTGEVIRSWSRRFEQAVAELLPPEQRPLSEAAPAAGPYNQPSLPPS